MFTEFAVTTGQLHLHLVWISETTSALTKHQTFDVNGMRRFFIFLEHYRRAA